MNTLAFPTLVALFFVSTVAAAQRNSFYAGIGIALNPAAIVVNNTDMFLPVGLMNIFVPLQISPHWRVEPEFGILSIRDNTTSGAASQQQSWQYTRFGTGVFYAWQPIASTQLYTGVRSGLLWYTTTRQTTNDIPQEQQSAQWSYYTGLCLGGEYYFSPHFSIGAEVQLYYVHIGNRSSTPPARGEAVRDIISNNSLVCARLYF